MEGGVEYIITTKNGVIKLPPGFRFHPTDEELVTQYLRRKVASLPLPATIIPEINLWKYDPCDLHGGGEGERYFFTTLEEVKHCRGNKSTRPTYSGFWKARGKAKPIFAERGGRAVGTKRTFVFYRQEKRRSQKINGSTRTSWIMDEYRLPKEFDMHRNTLMVNGMLPPQMKDWVVCKIFQKDSSKRVNEEERERVQDSNNHLVPSLSSTSCLTDLKEEREKDEEEEEEISS